MRSLAVVVVAASLTLAGCGEQTERTGGTSGTGAEVIGTGKTADYDFTGTTLDGDPFDGSALDGQPAVLWFWAPWCPTCRAQIGTVSQLAEEYDGQVTVVGIGGLDSETAIRGLAAQIPHVTHLVDDEGEVWQHFGVTAQSTYTVIGADGEIKAEGYLDNAELVTLVDRLAG